MSYSLLFKDSSLESTLSIRGKACERRLATGCPLSHCRSLDVAMERLFLL